jgi:hypothetical protein
MEKLIVGPFQETKITTLIIIDALDECRDEEPASALLSVLFRYLREIPLSNSSSLADQNPAFGLGSV